MGTLTIGLVVGGLVVLGSLRREHSGRRADQVRATGGAIRARVGETNLITARPALQVEQPEGAVRNRTEAIGLAREARRTDGRDLSRYEEPRASFHTNSRWNYWFVSFAGKSGAFGDHFAVRVDDLTGVTRVIKGR